MPRPRGHRREPDRARHAAGRPGGRLADRGVAPAAAAAERRRLPGPRRRPHRLTRRSARRPGGTPSDPGARGRHAGGGRAVSGSGHFARPAPAPWRTGPIIGPGNRPTQGAHVIPLTDNPLAFLHEDAYGFRPFVEQLDAAVAQARPLPLTVGVFGAWGTGKSSFLGMWSDLLAEQPRNRQVRFNPWKYDRKVEVWAALLHTILGELKKEERLREKAGRLARAATWLSLRAGLGSAATLATAGIVRPEHVNELLDTFAQNDADEYSQVNTFEDEFAEAVEEFVGPEGRLVVFVDDLDRCTPEAAMTVLESLKLFVGHARCVFVLALDVDVLAAVATNKFGVDLKGAPRRRSRG
ncbi:AAA family ATPase [Actinomadura sp. J1-007]|nr:AAA family ATPase [Actinomadura sp. J1-007]